MRIERLVIDRYPSYDVKADQLHGAVTLADVLGNKTQIALTDAVISEVLSAVTHHAVASSDRIGNLVRNAFTDIGCGILVLEDTQPEYRVQKKEREDDHI